MGGQAIVGAAVFLSMLGRASAQERPNVRLRHESTRRAVIHLLEEAASRLARPECAALLDEFRAEDGRTLRERLAVHGLTPPAYLDRVLFYDGDQEKSCRRKDVVAVTVPGARVVLVCPGFYRRSHREPVYAEAVLIHEALHTLGLGENPPSSREITHRVRLRCLDGRAAGGTDKAAAANP